MKGARNGRTWDETDYNLSVRSLRPFQQRLPSPPPFLQIQLLSPFQDDRKMFIGGLSWETTVDEMKEYFAKYGDVKDAGTCPLTLMG